MFNNILKLWIPLAFRFISRHKRKTAATGSFILVGTTIIVLINSITVGINDSMILNTTAVHYGHAFLEIPSGKGNPEKIFDQLRSINNLETSLLRYKFLSLLQKENKAAPAVIYAVNPEKESARTAIAKKIVSGKYPSLSGNDILLGSKIAESLNLDLGDNLPMYEVSGKSLGDFVVSGIFKTDINRLDEGVSYISSNSLNSDLKNNIESEISLFFKTGANIEKLLMETNNQLPKGLNIKRWEQMMPDLVQLIKMNELSMKIIMLFVFILVGFGISNTFILTIIERFKELGMMKAMGTTPKEIILLIFFESFFVCFIVTIAGLILGSILSIIIAYHGIDFTAFTSHNRYFVVSGIIKPRVTLPGLYWPFLLSITVSIISSYIPARIAAKKITADTLRFA